MKHTIDAQGKKLGRVASEAASLLMGKNLVDFARNVIPEVKVEVINTSKAKIDQKKKKEKIYVNYTGHPGGLFHANMDAIIKEKGFSEVFRIAIYGMLPHNKLTKGMMKNLAITE
ncbi:MAG: 50S ribosomal protein L13 [Candidatus Taylorbacteria bacterium]|nr:50S ribosomal protein L13 [Candidatus Taylorbacteria bacterium]